MLVTILAFFAHLSTSAFADVTHEGLFKCYIGMPWFSWQMSYHATEALARGSKLREGEDTPIIVLPTRRRINGDGSEKSSGEFRDGLYLYTEGRVYFFGFLVLPEPNRERIFALNFEEATDADRKIWVKYLKEPGAAPVLKLYSTWIFEANYISLKGEVLKSSDPQAVGALAAEIIGAVSSMKATSERQAQASAREGTGAADTLSEAFLDRLLLCGEIEHDGIIRAVKAEQRKFHIKGPGK